MLSMTTKTYDNLYWFEMGGFESETNGFCNNHIIMFKRLNVVHENKRFCSSVMFWKQNSFEIETDGFCTNDFLVLKRFNVVHDNQNLW